ncbi:MULTISPECIES: 4-hydroxy-tetrahydrodipicolinate synthase [Bacillaceae]|uniref:4-hydroxy-tetrahydrodipicolinate synthase n=1 Tax=Oceanobacillus caeni TaxID=405946 RepID=A0ABR5MGH7_9BACI|nr:MULTISPECIES: 4-hydroxy-tetrahydrodipicolinate synthase [Bacillaceae]KPH71725.1 dihydrodipicolinate synthase [Oceanobacillus caeni]MED4474606.1 4-hydroxy-tetrahydrodipicolinate synthase [Oceanobacillus caeni]
MNFGQVLTAMVTPFDKDGKLDYSQLEDLINYLLENGTDGLVVGGTTGESPTLSVDEKMKLFRHVVKIVNKRVPVIAGTGSYNTKESVELTKRTEALGVDGFLLVAPYYNKPNQEGMFQHFSQIAKETTLPIMLYNIPGRSIVNMDVDTVVRLSEIDNIVSIKEAGTDLDQISEIIEKTNDDFTVYSGNDSLTLPMLSIGATGVVSVASHIIGNEMKEMINRFFNGDITHAATMHRKLLSVMNGLFTSPSPAPVKAALQMKNIEVGGVRLPLVPLNEEERNELNTRIENIGL